MICDVMFETPGGAKEFIAFDSAKMRLDVFALGTATVRARIEDHARRVAARRGWTFREVVTIQH